jgi:hypothetical protein
MLLVVSPKEAKLYAGLQQEFAGVRGVMVMEERRRAERRVANRSVPTERRRAQRRIRWSDVSALGYAAVRFCG